MIFCFQRTDRQAVNTRAGHPRCEAFLENFHSLRHPEGPYSVWDAESVDLRAGEMSGLGRAELSVTCTLVLTRSSGLVRRLVVHPARTAATHCTTVAGAQRGETSFPRSFRAEGGVRWAGAVSTEYWHWPDINCRMSTMMQSWARKCRDWLRSPYNTQ